MSLRKRRRLAGIVSVVLRHNIAIISKNSIILVCGLCMYHAANKSILCASYQTNPILPRFNT